MSRFGTFGITLATSVALAATPALAVVKRATITGTTTSNPDHIHQLSTAGIASGTPFTLSYTYDTLRGTNDYYPGQGYNALYGSLLEGGNPILSASLTVNGISVHPSYPDTMIDIITLNSSPDATEIHFEKLVTNTVIPNGNIYIEAFYVTFNFQQYVETLESNLQVLHNSKIPNGFWTFTERNANGDIVSTNSVNFLGESLSITDAVPEPANWAMMIAGFGLIGATQRRRRLTTRSVAA